MTFLRNLTNNQRLWVSIGFVLFSVISFTCGVSMAKLLSPSINSVMVLFFRCLFGFAFFLPFILKNGGESLKSNHPWSHLLRVIFSCTAIFCTYYVYRKLPIATAAAIGYTSPLFVTLLAFFLLKERLNYKQWILMVVGYLGILMMVQPTSIKLTSACFIALLANISAATSIVFTKKLSKTDPVSTIMFYSNAFSFLIACIAVCFVWQTPSFKDFLLLCGVSLFGLGSNVLLSYALKFGRASVVSSFEYTRLIFIAFVGFIYFNEVPHWSIFAGAVVVCFATFLIARFEFNSVNKTVVLKKN